MKPQNWREMTPRERQVEKLKNYGLALAIAMGIVWLVVEGLTK